MADLSFKGKAVIDSVTINRKRVQIYATGFRLSRIIYILYEYVRLSITKYHVLSFVISNDLVFLLQ